jgi:hypothetical protein
MTSLIPALLRHALLAPGSTLRQRVRTSLRHLPVLVRYTVSRLSAGKLCERAPHEICAVGLRRQVPQSNGMISPQERAYFYGYARRLFTGRGDIVDLGCWLGATTISLASGLTANPRARVQPRQVHAFDRFVWEAWMADTESLGNPPFRLDPELRPRESFLDEFHRRTAPWKSRIRVHAGDLLAAEWPGRPIEFLLVDAMKSWELANSILRIFFPSLVPGRSILVHQDFAFYNTPWIHLITYRLRDYFQPLYHVPHSSSVAFALRRPIPADLLEETYAYASFSPEEADAAMAYSARLVAASSRANILAARVQLYRNQGDLVQARRLLEEYRARGIPFAGELMRVQKELESTLWRASF